MRIGVNISNDLNRRLKAIGQPINVSQVCRDAIETIVREQEELSARVEDDLMDIIAELVLERSGPQWADIDIKRYAQEDARDSLKEVDREWIERILRFREAASRTLSNKELDERSQGFYLHDCWNRYERRVKQHSDLLKQEEDHLDSLGLEHVSPWWNGRIEYGAAWVQYVSAFITGIEKRRRQKRTERPQRNDAQFPEPDLPDDFI